MIDHVKLDWVKRRKITHRDGATHYDTTDTTGRWRVTQTIFKKKKTKDDPDLWQAIEILPNGAPMLISSHPSKMAAYAAIAQLLRNSLKSKARKQNVENRINVDVRGHLPIDPGGRPRAE